MRHVLFLVVGLFLGVVGAHAVAARADGEGAPAADPADPGVRIDGLVARYERESAVMRAEIEYLRSREAALSKYVFSMNATATIVRTNVAEARTQGFEAAAIPANSRVAVLRTLDQLAGDLSGSLPVLTPNDLALRRKIDELRKIAGWR